MLSVPLLNHATADDMFEPDVEVIDTFFQETAQQHKAPPQHTANNQQMLSATDYNEQQGGASCSEAPHEYGLVPLC